MNLEVVFDAGDCLQEEGCLGRLGGKKTEKGVNSLRGQV